MELVALVGDGGGNKDSCFGCWTKLEVTAAAAAAAAAAVGIPVAGVVTEEVAVMKMVRLDWQRPV